MKPRYPLTAAAIAAKEFGIVQASPVLEGHKSFGQRRPNKTEIEILSGVRLADPPGFDLAGSKAGWLRAAKRIKRALSVNVGAARRARSPRPGKAEKRADL